MSSPGPILARGRTSDVFTFGTDSVVKVPRIGTPTHWAKMEAEVTDAVHRSGLPTPQVRELTTLDGREAIVFERIYGDSMWQQMIDHPSEIPALATLMATVQLDLNSVQAPSGLPALRDRMMVKISEAKRLTTTERREAKRLAESLAPDNRLCLGDLHPGNILMSYNGPIIIDWFDAAAGNRLADLVRTSLLIRPPDQGAPSPPHLPQAEPQLLEQLHDGYLKNMLSSIEDSTQLLHWERVLAVSRLAEHTQTDDRDLLSIWRSGQTQTTLSITIDRLLRAGRDNHR